MKTLAAIFIHGVGEETAGYSAFAQKTLSRALLSRGVAFYGQEVLWAPVLDTLERDMLFSVGKRGSRNNLTQRLVVGTLADALCYPNKREDILDLVDQAVARSRADEVHIFAHSLGGLIATDWLRSRPSARLHGLSTFGCNLQLFSLGSNFNCPAQIQVPGKWTSYFDNADMLGWPLGGWQPQVTDVKVNVGGLLGWTGLSHIEYWDDSRFWGKTVPGNL